MNEREYVKVNTSIQTGSNAANLHEDSEGNVEAAIELRLPNNLFDTNSGTREISQVDLKTSKMRLSMANTPIAKIPIDRDLTSVEKGRVVSSMQLDIYPFCMLDDGSFYPAPDRTDILATAAYKNKAITINIRDIDSTLIIKTWNGYANDLYNPLPDETIATFLEEAGVGIMHLMSVCVQGNHEKLNLVNSGKDLYLRNIGSLEQCLQDAIENAITYAYTSSSTEVVIRVSPTTSDDPKGVEISGHGFYKYVDHYIYRTTDCTLKNAVKPIVKLDQQSLSISFDSAAFDGRVPIIWSPANVDTNDHPVQLMMDDFRNSAWMQPPAKRPYNYPVIQNADNSWGYAIPTDNTISAPINIIVNKEFRDVFSFLPWIPMKIPIEPSEPSRVIEGVKTTEAILMEYNIQNSDDWFSRMYLVDDGAYSDNAHLYSVSGMYSSTSAWGWHYMLYSFDVETGVSPDDPENRTNQNIDFGNITVSSSDVRLTGPYLLIRGDVTVSTGVYRINNLGLTNESSLTNPEEYQDGQVISESWSPILAATSDTDLTATGTELSITDGQMIYTITSFAASIPGVYKLVGHDIGGEWADGVVPNAPSPMLEDYQFVSKAVNGNVTSYVYRYYYRSLYKLATEYEEDEETKTYSYVSLPAHVIYSRSLQREVAHINAKTGDAPSSESIIPNLLATEYFLLDGTPAVVTKTSPDLVFNSSAVGKCTTTTTKLYDRYVRSGTVKNAGDYIRPVCSDREGFGWDTLAQVSKVRITDNAKLHSVDIVVEFSYNSSNSTWEQVLNNTAPLHAVSVSIVTDATSRASTTSSVSLRTCTIYPDNVSSTRLVEDIDNDVKEELYYDTDLLPPDSETIVSDKQYPANTWAIQSGAMTSATTRALGGFLAQPDLSEEDGRYHVDNMYELPISTPYWNASLASASWRVGIPRLDYSSNELKKFYKVITSGNYTTYKFIFAMEEQIGTQFVGVDLYVSGTFQVDGTNYGANTAGYNGVPFTVYGEEIETSTVTSTASTALSKEVYGNTRITFTWNNLPTVVLSPIQSIVLTLEGIHVSQEYQPVNIAEPAGSSLTSTLPVIENYYSLATTLRDLHDEIVIVKDEFDDTATYKVSLTGGMQRSMRLSAKFIDKDGTLHSIYIPPNGVFTLQLTFGISYYVSTY